MTISRSEWSEADGKLTLSRRLAVTLLPMSPVRAWQAGGPAFLTKVFSCFSSRPGGQAAGLLPSCVVYVGRLKFVLSAHPSGFETEPMSCW